MKVGILTAWLMASFLFQDAAKEIDNPDFQGWKDQKVGAWVKLKMVQNMGPMNNEGTITKKLVEVTADKAVVEETTVMTINGKEMAMPATKREIKAKIAPEKLVPEGKFTKTGEGEEEVQVGDKKIKCQWFEGTFESEKMKDSKGTVKTWYSKEIIGGTAKSSITMEMPQGKMAMSLTYVESKKE